MKKILLALLLATVSAVTVADIPESNGKGEYKVFTGHSKGKATVGDKEKHRVTKHENLALKVHGEIRQDLGDG